RAAVDEYLLRIGVAPGVQHLARLRAHVEALGGADQAAQLRRLGLGRLVALRVLRVAQRLRAQLGVVLYQPRLVGEVAADALRQVDRRGGHHLQRVGDEGEHRAQALAVLEARIEDQQRERQRSEEEQPDERGRAPLEERRGAM